MTKQIALKIKEVLSNLHLQEVVFTVDVIEDEKMGDYATNVAMVLAKKVGKNPKELAEEIKKELEKTENDLIQKVEVAGPGFINFFLKPEVYLKSIDDILETGDNFGTNENLKGRKVLVEYTDPNPFKIFHIGHLMSNAIGESISRLIQFSGAEVKRANYQGDVGLHVAKCIWALREHSADPSDINAINNAYVLGSQAYEESEKSKSEIEELNRMLYQKDQTLDYVYKIGKKTSLEHFEEIYKKLGTNFDYYFFESEVADRGLATVKAHPEIFVESEGATVFRGEEVDPKLHTRVFVNKLGIPTYETKELGLLQSKAEKYTFDESISITASEQTDYFRVVKAAMEKVLPELGKKVRHIAHGMLRFAEGKMSSRKGNVITGESLIADVENLVREKMINSSVTEENRDEIITTIAIGAVKFSILKQAPGKDIIYDFEKSISFEGDSGPYLQYTHARIKSVLTKAGGITPKIKSTHEVGRLEKIIVQFPEVVSRAASEFAPQYIVTYLLEFASAFNTYYAQNKIIDPENKEESEHRLAISAVTAQVLKNGLWLLGIKAPERM